VLAEVRVRYRHTAAPATITPLQQKCSSGLDEPQRVITPGQATVFIEAKKLLAVAGREETGAVNVRYALACRVSS
jgi:tRNA U34 2-thiouridine synthase MnmA/TrmU